MDIDEELRNWAEFVHWGDNGGPEHVLVCASVESRYADHLSRFQWEAPIHPIEPNTIAGYLLERLINDLEYFPAVWRKVLRVHYLYLPDKPGVWRADEGYEVRTEKRAWRARVSPRSYPEYLQGAQRHLERVLPVSRDVESAIARQRELIGPAINLLRFARN